MRAHTSPVGTICWTNQPITRTPAFSFGRITITKALDFLRHRILCSGPALFSIAILLGAAAYSFAARAVAADAAAAARMRHLDEL